ncbi:MAG TPA: glycosyltransferase family 4 protein [Gemmatimonadaceae bacterium]|nr:glycosyltransferase family 4 protein [Gemmatimonadaceae bacterium]
MRILLVNWLDRENPQAGGAEVHLHEIFGRIAGRGHRVTLLASGWSGCAPRACVGAIDVHRVGRRYTFGLHAHRYYRRHLAAEPFDILVEDINKVPLFTPRWGAGRTMALVPHLFGSTVFQEVALPIASVVWTLERPIGRLYHGIPFEAISESTASDLVTRGIPRRDIKVIFPGIDTSHYTPDPDGRSQEPVFGYVGRLKRYKRVDLVLRAFAALAHPTATLEIAGTGDHAAALQRLAKSLDLGARVRFLGFISESEKLSLLRRAWAVALTSPKEGWGITNLEAAACGTPVVASSSPGLRESVRDGETGFLVPHGDVPALAAALRRLAADRSLVARMGLAGRRFAQEFTWERAATETEAHLSEIVAGAEF